MEKNTIDLRSDTVTRPTAPMRAAMAAAKVGDDVYGEDPAVCELERQTARLLGKESGLFMPSGTQSNLAAVLSHCARGDEFIIGDCYHIYCFEAGGAAVLGGISPCPVSVNPGGGMDAEKVRAAIKEEDAHYPRTKLVSMENTVGGKPQRKAETAAVAALARERGLSLHLDGARLLNAAVALDCDAADLAADFDSVSLCLSKGLGAPVGSVLCGDGGFIRAARRNRKILGGGMRQSGVLAAAGIYALENHVARLADDHKLARRIADGLRPLFGDALAFSGTNMVFVTVADCAPLIAFLAERGVLVGGRRGAIRIVTHLDVCESDADAAIKAFGDYCEASDSA